MGLSQAALNRLQLVKNAAARLLTTNSPIPILPLVLHPSTAAHKIQDKLQDPVDII